MENNNDMMAFEEVETNDEFVDTKKNNGAKALIGIGTAGFVLGVLAHKFAKPIARKVKSKFEKKDDVIEVDFSETESETEAVEKDN